MVQDIHCVIVFRVKHYIPKSKITNYWWHFFYIKIQYNFVFKTNSSSCYFLKM